MIWYAPLHSWLSLGLCTVFKHTSTSCDPALKETKALFTLSAAHTWSKPWLPGSLHSMACVPQEHTNRDHTAVLWEKIWHLISLHCSLQLEVSISSLSQHLCQNALAPGMADNHQHPPPEVTKKNKGVQRLLQKHTACFCSAHCLFSAPCQSYHRKPHALGLSEPAQTRAMDGYTQMPARASLGQMVFVAPIIFLTLNCQPSCDIASC